MKVFISWGTDLSDAKRIKGSTDTTIRTYKTLRGAIRFAERYCTPDKPVYYMECYSNECGSTYEAPWKTLSGVR